MNVRTTRSRLLGLDRLFHISFNAKLEGLWTPGEQAGFDTPGESEDSTWAYPEPPMQAICLSDDIGRCFRGVYPNVAKFFEKENFPHINFCVYGPDFDGSERVVLPETLTKDKLVWDAHVTKEYRVLDPVEMKLLGKIQVQNTNKSPTLKTHPFNDPKNPEESVGPRDIKWKWVK